ncbi:ferredoxin reductase [Streptomyces albus]|nr:ferredoxin reductase [Streptomyces albus]
MVVVGAGHAGGTLVGLLRQSGFAGEILLFGLEKELPYHRPPLSKKFFGEQEAQWLKAPEFYAEQDVQVRLGESVAAIDRADKTVTTGSGEVVPYDFLVLATGAEPRQPPFPGRHLQGVLTLRTLADAGALREALSRGGRLVVVGGGYIGLEVAAAARAEGVEATVVEREDRVLARVASTRLSEIMTAYHLDRGTRILTGAEVSRLTGSGGKVAAVDLTDGRTIECDTVLIGVGAVPCDGLAREAGLRCDQGIAVDSSARTDDPRILAIGDVTCRPVTGAVGARRLESIPSAVEQAKQAAAVIVGAQEVPPEVPWFWSDQFDLKLKIAGFVPPTPSTVVRGDPSTGRFALFHHVDGLVNAVESANSPADFMAGKRFIAQSTRVDPGKLADLNVPLRQCLAEQPRSLP